jgi:oligopeptide transport system substrate-binding protein
LALDRREFVKTVTRGPEQPALHLVPPGIPGYESPTLGEPNAEQARKLLAEAGFPDGRGFPRLEILYNTHEQHQAIAELARKQWQRELGITVTLQNEVWASALNRLRLKEYDIGRQSWTGDYIDPNTFLDMYITNGDNNQTGWSNARYDELIEQAMSIVDPAERMASLAEAEAILMDEVPIVPIYFYYSRSLVKPYVRGWYNNLQDTHPLSAIWIDKTQQSPNPFLDPPAQ